MRRSANAFSVAIVVIIALLIDGAFGVAIEGFLADRRCVDLGVASDGANMITRPQDHTVKCALMPPCIASGYTILTPPLNSNGSYGPMYNLTVDSNAKAVAFLSSLPPTRANLRVRVHGNLQPSGVLNITDLAIQDIGAATAAGAPVNVTAYIADRLCLDQVVAVDGADMQEAPQEHTAMCLMLTRCRRSGFALLRPKRAVISGRVPLGYGAIYNLTNGSNALVEAWAATLDPGRNTLLVTTRVTIDADGVATFSTAAGQPATTVQLEDLGVGNYTDFQTNESSASPTPDPHHQSTAVPPQTFQPVTRSFRLTLTGASWALLVDSGDRDALKNALRADLSAALGVDSKLITIDAIGVGSLIVEFTVTSTTSGEDAKVANIAEVQQALSSPNTFALARQLYRAKAPAADPEPAFASISATGTAPATQPPGPPPPSNACNSSCVTAIVIVVVLLLFVLLAACVKFYRGGGAAKGSAGEGDGRGSSYHGADDGTEFSGIPGGPPPAAGGAGREDDAATVPQPGTEAPGLGAVGTAKGAAGQWRGAAQVKQEQRDERGQELMAQAAAEKARRDVLEDRDRQRQQEIIRAKVEQRRAAVESGAVTVRPDGSSAPASPQGSPASGGGPRLKGEDTLIAEHEADEAHRQVLSAVDKQRQLAAIRDKVESERARRSKSPAPHDDV